MQGGHNRTRRCLAGCCAPPLICSDLRWVEYLSWERQVEGEELGSACPSQGRGWSSGWTPAEEPHSFLGLGQREREELGDAGGEHGALFRVSVWKGAGCLLAQEGREMISEEGRGKVQENLVGLPTACLALLSGWGLVLSESSRSRVWIPGFRSSSELQAGSET